MNGSKIVELACLEPVAKGLHITHWSSEDQARQAVADGIVAHISPRAVRNILSAVDLQPHRTRYWKTARLDVWFKEKGGASPLVLCQCVSTCRTGPGLSHGAILHCGQLFPQFLRGQLEDSPRSSSRAASDPAGHTASDSCGGRRESDGGSRYSRFRSSKPCVILRCLARCIRATLLSTHSTRLLARHTPAQHLVDPPSLSCTNRDRVFANWTVRATAQPRVAWLIPGVVPDSRQGWRRNPSRSNNADRTSGSMPRARQLPMRLIQKRQTPGRPSNRRVLAHAGPVRSGSAALEGPPRLGGDRSGGPAA